MTESAMPPPEGQVPPPYTQAPPPAYTQPPAQPYHLPQQGFAPPPGTYPVPMMTGNDVRLWAGAAHWSAFIAGFVGPLVIMLTKGNENPFVRRQAVESLNFQISCAIAEIVSVVLLLVLIGFILLPAVILFHLVFTIIGAVKVSQGEDYRYPISLRLVS